MSTEIAAPGDKLENVSTAETKGPGDVPELSPVEKTFVAELINLTATGILIKKSTVGVRMFCMANGESIVSFILQETNDGYVVALPAVLMVNGEGEVDARYISPNPIVKLHKQTLPLMALPTPTILYYYLRAIQSKYREIPGFFNKDRIIQIDSLVAQLGRLIPDRPKATMETPDVDSTLDPSKASPNSFFIENKNNKYVH